VELLFCQAVSPDVEMGKWSMVFHANEDVLMAQNIGKLDVDRGMTPEGVDCSDEVNVRSGAWDIFVEVLRLEDGALVITANHDTTGADMMVVAKEFYCD